MVGSGEVPEWPKGADCKSAGVSLRRFESSPLHMTHGDQHVTSFDAGIAQLVRASAFQAEGRGFESRFPLSAGATRNATRGLRKMPTSNAAGGHWPLPARGAQVAQSAEHVLGKDEVGGSIPLLGFSRR